MRKTVALRAFAGTIFRPMTSILERDYRECPDLKATDDFRAFVQDALWDYLHDRTRWRHRAILFARWLVAAGQGNSRMMGLYLLDELSLLGELAAGYYLAEALFAHPERPEDVQKANRLVRRLAKSKGQYGSISARAALELARSKLSGRGGMPVDLRRARDLFIRAADSGNRDAAYEAARFFHGRVDGWQEDPDFDRAAEYYHFAYSQGAWAARVPLGILHTFGLFRDADRPYGMSLLRKASAQGDAVAADALHQIEVNGGLNAPMGIYPLKDPRRMPQYGVAGRTKRPKRPKRGKRRGAHRGAQVGKKGGKHRGSPGGPAH